MVLPSSETGHTLTYWVVMSPALASRSAASSGTTRMEPTPSTTMVSEAAGSPACTKSGSRSVPASAKAARSAAAAKSRRFIEDLRDQVSSEYAAVTLWVTRGCPRRRSCESVAKRPRFTDLARAGLDLAHRLGGAEPLLRCARDGAGARPERELRASECLLASPCARSRLEGQSRDSRVPRPAASLCHHELPAAECDPAPDVRPSPTRRDETDLEEGPFRSGRLAVRLLRVGEQSPHARPRGAALARRYVRMGERGHVLRPVQPSQGRSPARGDEHEAPKDAAAANARPVHPAHDRADPGHLAQLPARARGGRGRVASASATSPARPPPALRARGRPTSVPGRDPSRRSGRSRVP